MIFVTKFFWIDQQVYSQNSSYFLILGHYSWLELHQHWVDYLNYLMILLTIVSFLYLKPIIESLNLWCYFILFFWSNEEERWSYFLSLHILFMLQQSNYCIKSYIFLEAIQNVWQLFSKAIDNFILFSETNSILDIYIILEIPHRCIAIKLLVLGIFILLNYWIVHVIFEDRYKFWFLPILLMFSIMIFLRKK